jgi:hypothetical protein
MAVQNLHEAAVVLRGAYEAIDKLLTEIEPMQRAYHAKHLARALSDEELEALWAETGYGPFADAAMDLVALLESIEDMDREEAHKRLNVA